ncbi:MAG: alpha/beta fold hydrolase [bacterium]
MLNWNPEASLELSVRGVRLEGRCWGPAPEEALTLVLLHEGLGSVGLWKAFPQQLAERSGCGVFAYSRAGYGRSDPVALPRPLDYMTREADETLGFVLDQVGSSRVILLGHSDGASIASLYAGRHPDARVLGVVLMAPHFFTEPGGLASIAEARTVYQTTDLPQKLARYHADPDNAFWGWNQAWLDPGFRSWNIEFCLKELSVPVLAIQGQDDQYGTSAQVEVLKEHLNGSAEVHLLEDCRHSPHFEQPERTLNLIAQFVRQVSAVSGAS